MFGMLLVAGWGVSHVQYFSCAGHEAACIMRCSHDELGVGYVGPDLHGPMRYKKRILQAKVQGMMRQSRWLNQSLQQGEILP